MKVTKGLGMQLSSMYKYVINHQQLNRKENTPPIKLLTFSKVIKSICLEKWVNYLFSKITKFICNTKEGKKTKQIIQIPIIPHKPMQYKVSQATDLLLTWFVYIASKALLNSMACSCLLESLNSTPSALVNFTFFLESKTFWS